MRGVDSDERVARALRTGDQGHRVAKADANTPSLPSPKIILPNSPRVS